MRKLESAKRILQLFFSGIGLALQVLLFRYYYYMYYSTAIKLEFWKKGHILVIVIYAFLLITFSAMYGAMKIGYLKPAEIAFSQIMSTFIVNIVTYLQLSLMCMKLMFPWNYVRMSIYQLIIAFAW
ncbi:MAG: hypothetical protein J6Y09_04205, partial [Lachnospiraceae bacterium]|nr:hypothetical protein [Lachnospiraceae bacterium]